MRHWLPFLLLLGVLTFALSASAGESQQRLLPEGEAREVSVAMFMADLTEVSGASQTFAADVYLLSTWIDPELVGKFEHPTSLPVAEVWHPTLNLLNLRSAQALAPQEVVVRKDGRITRLERYNGTFTERMDLRNFPMDRQVFSVTVVASTRAGANVVLVPNRTVGALRSPELAISDWEVGQATFSVDTVSLAPGMPTSPSATLSIPAKRRFTYYFIQVLIPLLAIVLMAYSVFWVDPNVVATRVGVVVTTMLTIIAYRFTLSNHVPRLAYLTRLDWFMVGGTIMVLLTLFTMAAASLLLSRGDEKLVAHIDRIGRIAYPAAFATYTCAVWVL